MWRIGNVHGHFSHVGPVHSRPLPCVPWTDPQIATPYQHLPGLSSKAGRQRGRGMGQDGRGGVAFWGPHPQDTGSRLP